MILRVGDIEVTQAEFESRIEDIEPQTDPDRGGDADKDRRRLGDDYASVLMLSQQALANHLDKTPDVSRQLEVERLQILSDAQFASLMKQAAPAREEVSQYYADHPAEFDRVRIRRLFIWKHGGNSQNARGLEPEAARGRADAILKAPAATGAANQLAEAFQGSEDGLLDREPIIFTRGELPARMEQVAFAMKESDWSEADDTPDAIILIHLVKRDRRPLEEVWSLIEQKLQARKMQTRLNELKKNSGIWMDEEYFGREEANTPSGKSTSKLGK